MSVISLSSDDSQDAFIVDDNREGAHEVFVFENNQNGQLHNVCDSFNFEEEMRDHAFVKQEVLVSFAGIDSLKREPDEEDLCNVSREESTNGNVEECYDGDEIEYNLSSVDIAEAICPRQQEDSDVCLEHPPQFLHDGSDPFIHVVPHSECRILDIPHQSRLELLAKRLADTLENNGPSTSQAEDISFNSCSAPVFNREGATDGHSTTVSKGSSNIATNQTGEGCSGIVIQNMTPREQKEKRIVNTIYNVSVGNYCSVTGEEIDSIKDHLRNRRILLAYKKRMDKLGKRFVKESTQGIYNNTNHIDGYCVSPSGAAIDPSQHDFIYYNSNKVNSNRKRDKVNQPNANYLPDEPIIKRKNFNKTPKQRAKEDLNTIKMQFMKSYNKVNRLMGDKRDFERTQTNKTALKESTVKSKCRKLSVDDNLGSSLNSMDHQPICGTKMTFSRDKNSGNISVAMMPPLPVKPMVACKPIQRNVFTPKIYPTDMMSTETFHKETFLQVEDENKPSNEVGTPKTVVQNTNVLQSSNELSTNHLRGTFMNSMKDNTFRATFVRCYNTVFDNDGEIICLRMSDLLLLSIKENREFKKRIESVKKLSCEQLKVHESSHALKNYTHRTKNYIHSFERLFMDIYGKIFKILIISGMIHCKPLLVAWFLKIFLKVCNIFPELSDCFEEVKSHIINELFKNLKGKVPEIHETFGEHRTNFKHECWLVLELMKDCFKEDEELNIQESRSKIFKENMILDATNKSEDLPVQSLPSTSYGRSRETSESRGNYRGYIHSESKGLQHHGSAATPKEEKVSKPSGQPMTMIVEHPEVLRKIVQAIRNSPKKTSEHSTSGEMFSRSSSSAQGSKASTSYANNENLIVKNNNPNIIQSSSLCPDRPLGVPNDETPSQPKTQDLYQRLLENTHPSVTLHYYPNKKGSRSSP